MKAATAVGYAWHYNSQKVHCPRGHPYDEANTYLWRGERFCRACHRLSEHRRNQKSSAGGRDG